MKTLHLYLMRQVLATLLMTVAVFTFVLLLGNATKEILVLLINRQATLLGVAQAFGLLIPFVLVFALPMGMLTAALLVFGRFSADQELTAVRSSGVSLMALITPMLLLSLALCGVSAWINLDLGPRCRVAYKGMIEGMRSKVVALLPEGRYVQFPNCAVYVKSSDGRELRDILIWKGDDKVTGGELMISAARGRLETVNERMILLLYEARTLRRLKNETNWNVTLFAEYPVEDLDFRKATSPDTPLSDMTYRQLQGQLRQLEQRFSLPTPEGATLDEMIRWKSELSEHEMDITLPIRFQMHRQVAFSFACFGFTLVGIPLGIRAHRRETNIGVAMALLLVLVYYSFVILGQSLQTHAEWAPHLIVWLPNFVFQAAGAVMLWRANRGI